MGMLRSETPYTRQTRGISQMRLEAKRVVSMTKSSKGVEITEEMKMVQA
jgi:hypothetical protein